MRAFPKSTALDGHSPFHEAHTCYHHARTEDLSGLNVGRKSCRGDSTLTV